MDRWMGWIDGMDGMDGWMDGWMEGGMEESEGEREGCVPSPSHRRKLTLSHDDATVG